MTALSYRSLAPRILLIAAATLAQAPLASAQSDTTAASETESITLSNFQVNTSRDKGYRASNSVTGSRIDTPIKDLPFALQAFTQEFIEDIHPANIYDIALYSPGVVYRSSDFSNGNMELGIRGFNATQTLRDGLRGPAILEFSNVERVEVVKGPASFLYGQLAPGGVVNVITKAPKEKFQGSAQATYGSYGEYGGLVDVTGPAGKSLLYRVVAAYTQDMHFWQPYDSHTTDVAPQFLYKLNDKASVRITFEKFAKNESPQLFQLPGWGFTRSGLPASFAAQADPLVANPVWPVGLPKWTVGGNDPNLSGVLIPGLPQNFNQMSYSDFRRSKDTTLTAILDVKADEHWDVRVSYGFDKNSIDMTWSGRPVANPNINLYTAAYNAALASGLSTAQAEQAGAPYSGFLMPRRWRWQTTEKVSNTMEAQALGKYDFGGVSLKLMLGAQHNPSSFRQKNGQMPDLVTYTGAFSGVSGPRPYWDLRDPSTWDRTIPSNFSRFTTAVDANGLSTNNNDITRSLDEAIYGGATWGFFHDTLLALTGMRRTYTSIQTEHDLNRNIIPGRIVSSIDPEFKSAKNTPQIGALYKVLPAVSVFASYSESFVPGTGTLNVTDKSNPAAWTTVAGGPIKPTEGKGYDVGVKTSLFDGRVSATVSYYDVKNANILASLPETGPNGIFFATFQSGEQEAKGLEADVTYSPLDHWQIYASASIQNATQTIVVTPSEDARLLAVNTYAGYQALNSGDQSNWRNVWRFKGKPLQMTAPHSYNVWTKYDFTGPLHGFYIGGGANIMRDQTISPETESQNHQTYVLWNALVGYNRKIAGRPVSFSLNGKNLTNEIYLPSQNTASRPREFVLSVKTSF